MYRGRKRAAGRSRWHSNEWWNKRDRHGAVNRRSPMRRLAAVGAALIMVVTGVPVALTLSAASGQPGDSSGAANGVAAWLAGAEPVTVTLITGDVVTYTDVGDGQPTFDVAAAPREDGTEVAFWSEGTSDDFYVFPSDAAAYVNTGVLDRELFNIPALARQGLDDEATDAMPVIVTFDEQASSDTADAADALPATSDPVAIETVNGAGVSVERKGAKDFWNAVAADWASQRSRAAVDDFSKGVEHVLLDRIYEIDLAESVPQIGAPEAWESGFTGEGVTVAVLDTGVDADHPDLAGQVVGEKNFTEEADANDNHGHGTHVSSTIAGTGAASDGQYTGVAPGVEILNGKVCNASGQCASSSILAGMEWAAGQGADIVNMSLGGSPTDGTDLVSQTLNDLSAATDTLFVVSAGNYGGYAGNPHKVGSPGAADAALTVGAVDKNDGLTWFSSRGPRLGDFAVKPNLTAPGAAIVAARAAGTSMGRPVNDSYTAADGTSMAAPHVAGAAALLAQARPGLDAMALKDVLVSTAADGGYEVFEQGTGRVDVPAALDHELYGPTAVSFGDLDGVTEPVERTVTYINTSDEPVTLELGTSLTTIYGDTAEGLTLSAAAISVPANGQASLTATADPEVSGKGIFNGVITATAPGVSLRTGVGFGQVGEHTVTVNVLDHNGRPVCDACHSGVMLFHDTWDPDSRVGKQRYKFGTADGVASGRVPTGTYTVFTGVLDHPANFSRLSELIELEVVVRGDVTITLDARDATLMSQPNVPRRADVRAHVQSLCREQPSGNTWCYAGADNSGNEVVGSRAFDVYVTPAPAWKILPLFLWEKWTLAEPLPLQPIPNMSSGQRYYSAAPAYVYQVPLLYERGIPDTTERGFPRRDFVKVPVSYHADRAETLIVTSTHTTTDRADGSFGGVKFTPHVTYGSGEVNEYYLADSRFLWWRADWLRYVPEAGMPETFFPMYTHDAFPESEAGTRRDAENRFEAPFGHGVAEVNPQWMEVARDGNLYVGTPSATIPVGMARGGPDDTLFLPPTAVVDNSRLHRYGVPSGIIGFETSWRMWNADTGAELDPIWLGYGDIPGFQGMEAGTYKLEESFAYPAWMAPYFRTKPAATTTWTFQSAPSSAEVPDGYKCWALGGAVCQIQPLIQLRYELGLDVHNQAPAGRAHIVTINAGHHSQAVDRAEVTDVSLEMSFDGGETWQNAHALVTPDDAESTAEQSQRFLIQHPPLDRTDGFVALRVRATDANGGTIEQTIERAYILK